MASGRGEGSGTGMGWVGQLGSKVTAITGGFGPRVGDCTKEHIVSVRCV